MRNGNGCIWIYINTQKHRRLYGTTISILPKEGEKSVAVIRINGDRIVLLLIYGNKDISSESREIEIGVARLIFKQKISKALWDNDIHTQ